MRLQIREEAQRQSEREGPKKKKINRGASLGSGRERSEVTRRLLRDDDGKKGVFVVFGRTII